MQLSKVIFACTAAGLSLDGGTKGVRFAGAVSIEEEAGGAGVRGGIKVSLTSSIYKYDTRCLWNDLSDNIIHSIAF